MQTHGYYERGYEKAMQEVKRALEKVGKEACPPGKIAIMEVEKEIKKRGHFES